MPGRLTDHDYEALAKKRDFEWLGPPVDNTKTKTRWRCSKNHSWVATYSSIRQGTGCPICLKDARNKTEVDYHALARHRGFEWLGPLPKDVNALSEWCCAKKHTWFATYNGIRLRGLCPICAKHDNQRKTERDYVSLAKKRGIEWLGPPVKNTKTKTQWRCSKEHAWFTTYNSIQQGSGCGKCQRLKRKKRAKG